MKTLTIVIVTIAFLLCGCKKTDLNGQNYWHIDNVNYFPKNYVFLDTLPNTLQGFISNNDNIELVFRYKIKTGIYDIQDYLSGIISPNNCEIVVHTPTNIWYSSPSNSSLKGYVKVQVNGDKITADFANIFMYTYPIIDSTTLDGHLSN